MNWKYNFMAENGVAYVSDNEIGVVIGLFLLI